MFAIHHKLKATIMKKSFFLFTVFAVAVVSNAFGQKQTIELTFTAQYQSQNIMLDSIYIKNHSQGGDTMLYAPDTVLVLDFVTGVASNPALNTGFRVSQNRPNPFAEQTIISIFLPEADHLQVSVLNLLGQKVAFFESSLDAGNHSFVFYPGDGKYYILNATANGLKKTIKMVSLNNYSGKYCSLSYVGTVETEDEHKSIQETNDFGYSLGDQLLFIGFAKNPSDIVGSDVIKSTPTASENYLFEIIEGLPCPNTPLLTYQGQIYRTLQIGSQCWFKENLNVGNMIPGNQSMTDNAIIEKYCYDNDPAYCETYGGLYQWNEMMQYTTQQGTKGICPTGWHIPTDEEWCTMAQFIEPIAECNEIEYIGTEIGIKMKSRSGWNSGGNGTNETGFNVFPVGERDGDGVFFNLGYFQNNWSSTEFTEDTDATEWILGFDYDPIRHHYEHKYHGFSVRCLRNN
jgi:uncharacterized protein (TIGR02145 family)